MLNYSDLYEVLRREKINETLQPMEQNFILEYASYLNEINQNILNISDMFSDFYIKNKKQIENAIAIFRELMLRRKKKILSLVFVAAETGIMKRDYENMLSFERDVFDKLVKAFEEGDKELSKLIIGKKEKDKEKFRMIMFNQNIEQFVDMSGGVLGPFATGELANLKSEVAGILVSGGKAHFVDES